MVPKDPTLNRVNESIGQQIFPDDLKVARVTPIRKGGERDDVGNY